MGCPAATSRLPVLALVLRVRPARDCPPRSPGAAVETPLYRVTFGQDGAVRAWGLHYRGEKPLVVGGGPGPLAVGISRPGQALEVVPLRPEVSRLDLGPAHPVGTLSFQGAT